MGLKMATQVKTPQIYLPTGYEGLQHKAAAKRRLAEAMQQSGMQMAANPMHIAQVLGSLAQQWVGRDAEKQADKFDLEAGQRMGQDYRTRFGEFQTDAKVLSPAQMVEKYGADPLMADQLKPYSSTMEAGMKEEQQLGFHDGINWGRKGQVALGSMKPNDPNDKVIRGPNREWMINPTAVTAAIAAQGLAPENPTMVMRDPAESQVPPAVGQPSSQSQVPPVSMSQVNAAMQALGPEGTIAWMKQNKIIVKVQSPDEARQLPSGTPIILPDGTEGEVP